MGVRKLLIVPQNGGVRNKRKFNDFGNLVLLLQYLLFFLNRITTNRVSVMIMTPNENECVKTDQLYNIPHMLNNGRERTTTQSCNSQKHL